jgi:hypothetical protein
MTVTITCKHCNTVITADDDDDLVVQVQAHVAGHPGEPASALTRDHILARLRRLQGQDDRHR